MVQEESDYIKTLIHRRPFESPLSRCGCIDINMPFTKDALKIEILKTIQKNSMSTDVHIRLIVSRGLKTAPYQNPKVTISPPTVVIIQNTKKLAKM